MDSWPCSAPYRLPRCYGLTVDIRYCQADSKHDQVPEKYDCMQLVEKMYQPYATLLAGFGFVVVQYNLPRLKLTDFDTEADALPQFLTWVKQHIDASIASPQITPDWLTLIAAGHSRGGFIAFKQLQQSNVVTAALLDAVSSPGATLSAPSDPYLVLEGMRSPVCAPAGLGFINRTFNDAPMPLPFTRLKLPQAGHMQFCETGRAARFWNVMCGCGKTSNDAVIHHAAALMTGYLLEGGYSSLLDEVLQPAVAAYQEWRGALLNSGVIQDFSELHTANSPQAKFLHPNSLQANFPPEAPDAGTPGGVQDL